MPALPRTRADARRLYLRHRRLLASVLAAACVLVTIGAVSPDQPHRSPVVVAAHDLTAGSVLAAADLSVVHLPADLVPRHALSRRESLVGRHVAAPMRGGEPFTDRRLFSDSLIDGYGEGLVAVPVRASDAVMVSLLHVGDRVDLYATDHRDGQQQVTKLAANAPVIALPQPAKGRTGSHDAVVVVAVPAADAGPLTQAGAQGAVSIALRQQS